MNEIKIYTKPIVAGTFSGSLSVFISERDDDEIHEVILSTVRKAIETHLIGVEIYYQGYEFIPTSNICIYTVLSEKIKS